MHVISLIMMFSSMHRIAIRLSVGRLQNLALSRVVPEQLLDQVDVSEQHAAAAVAGESQLVERGSIGPRSVARIPPSSYRLFAGPNIPLVNALAFGASLFDQFDISGPEISDDLMFAKDILLVSFLVRDGDGGCALTLPQEKQRTGMIILVGRDGEVCR
jgi:hypothetical protein